MIKKISKFLVIVSLFTIVLAPTLSFAQAQQSDDKGLVPCGKSVYGDSTFKDEKGVISNHPETGYKPPVGTLDVSRTVSNPCTFDDFLKLVNNVVNFILVDLAIPIAAIMMAYAGFQLITSGGEASKRTQAKSILTNAIIGLILAAAAVIIVKTILTTLGFVGTDTFFK